MIPRRFPTKQRGECEKEENGVKEKNELSHVRKVLGRFLITNPKAKLKILTSKSHSARGERIDERSLLRIFLTIRNIYFRLDPTSSLLTPIILRETEVLDLSVGNFSFIEFPFGKREKKKKKETIGV